MKKTILFTILGILLVGLVIGATTLSSMVEIKSDLYDKYDYKIYSTDYKINELENGQYRVCVFINKHIAGCKEVEEKDIELTEKVIVERYLEMSDRNGMLDKETINTEIGQLTITKSKDTPILEK